VARLEGLEPPAFSFEGQQSKGISLMLRHGWQP